MRARGYQDPEIFEVGEIVAILDKHGTVIAAPMRVAARIDTSREIYTVVPYDPPTRESHLQEHREAIARSFNGGQLGNIGSLTEELPRELLRGWPPAAGEIVHIEADARVIFDPVLPIIEHRPVTLANAAEDLGEAAADLRDAVATELGPVIRAWRWICEQLTRIR